VYLADGGVRLTWEARGKHPIAYWVVAYRSNGEWYTQVLPASASSYTLPPSAKLAFVSVVDRYGNQSEWVGAGTG
jgi:hypothetical protein